MNLEIQSKKTGRNDQCPCESGLKYKKCCLSNNSIITTSDQKASQKRLMNSVKNQLGDKAIFIENDKIKIKMSKIIVDLADDFLVNAKSRYQKEAIIKLTCFAWNIAVQFHNNELKIEKVIEKIASKIWLDDDKNELKKLMKLLIKRKLSQYPDVDRFIMNYDLVGKGENFHLNVISAMNPDELEL